jgi:hypothetical protein
VLNPDYFKGIQFRTTGGLVFIGGCVDGVEEKWFILNGMPRNVNGHSPYAETFQFPLVMHPVLIIGFFGYLEVTTSRSEVNRPPVLLQGEMSQGRVIIVPSLRHTICGTSSTPTSTRTSSLHCHLVLSTLRAHCIPIRLFTAMYAPSKRAVCLILGIIVTQVLARCYDPSPAFPLPKHYDYQESERLKQDFRIIENELEKLVSDSKFDISSYSIEITTSEGTLWENHHTSKEKDPKRPGATNITGNSVYRMASVTKCFTTLALLQQHIAENLSLDDTVDMYLSDLSGSIPWKDITLKTMASQLSGIPRDCAMLSFSPYLKFADDIASLGK